MFNSSCSRLPSAKSNMVAMHAVHGLYRDPVKPPGSASEQSSSSSTYQRTLDPDILDLPDSNEEPLIAYVTLCA